MLSFFQSNLFLSDGRQMVFPGRSLALLSVASRPTSADNRGPLPTPARPQVRGSRVRPLPEAPGHQDHEADDRAERHLPMQSQQFCRRRFYAEKDDCLL